MKLPQHRIVKWFGLTLAAFMLTGCYKEDLSACSTGLDVNFRLMKGGAVNLFGPEVTSVSVFVFDEQGLYVGRWDEFDPALLTNDYVMHIPLGKGTYSCIVWGGMHGDHYHILKNGVSGPLVAGETSISELCLLLKQQETTLYQQQCTVVDYTQDNQYYGNKAGVEVTNRITRVGVDLMKNTNTLRLTLKNLPRSQSNGYDQLNLYFEAINGRCDFANIIPAAARKLTYLPQNVSVSQNGDLHLDFVTQRMVYGGCDHKLNIYNTETGTMLFSKDLLTNYISKVPAYMTQQGLDDEDLYEITIDMSPYASVKVTVNGWAVETSGNEIQ